MRWSRFDQTGTQKLIKKKPIKYVPQNEALTIHTHATR